MSKNKMILRISAETNKGVVRGHNEDDHYFNPDLKTNKWLFYEKTESFELGEWGSLIVVADGMGGTNAGEVASRLAKEGIQDYFSDNLKTEVLASENAIRSFLKSSILSANEKIVNRQKQDKETEGMGTTIILAWLHGNRLYISWSGDSRCYCYNPESGLQSLSKDHSYVQELVDKGQITYEQAFYHPDSNIITQSLGDERHKPKPDFASYELQSGDKILLCSDGLNAMLEDVQIREIFKKNEDINTCVRTLIEETNEAGGHDNITIAIAEIISTNAAAASKSAAQKGTYVKYGGIALVVLFLLFAYFKISGDSSSDYFIASKDMSVILKKGQLTDTLSIKKGDTLYREFKDMSLLSKGDSFRVNSDFFFVEDSISLLESSVALPVKSTPEPATEKPPVPKKIKEKENPKPTKPTPEEQIENPKKDTIAIHDTASDEQDTPKNILTPINKYDPKKDLENIGLSPLPKDGKWGYIGLDGKIKIEYRYQMAYQFEGGYAFVKSGGKWGAIDKDGVYKIKPQAFWGDPKDGFGGGKASVTKLNGREIICIDIKDEKVNCN